MGSVGYDSSACKIDDAHEPSLVHGQHDGDIHYVGSHDDGDDAAIGYAHGSHLRQIMPK